MAHEQAVGLGQALVDFALHSGFPDDEASSRRIAADDLQPALESLAAAKSHLQAQIHSINEETAPDVQSWMTNAKALEDDINKSRSLANEIVRRAEAPEVSGQSILEAEEKVGFLQREVSYTAQVREALTNIKRVNEMLDQVEQARNERRVLDSLHLLEKSWTAMDEIPVSKSCRVMRTLDMRAFELKSAVHDVFDHVWNSLVRVDGSAGRLEIHQARDDEPMTLSEALIGLQAYKEVDQRMALFWHSVDEAIIGPRTALHGETLPGISADDTTLAVQGQADSSISALFADLRQITEYLAKSLPEDLVRSLSNVMMPALVPRIIHVWLDTAVPVSLREMDDFQEVISAARQFCTSLAAMKYTGFEELQEWVDSAPRVWLAKCRETALDSIRNKMSQGLGAPKEVERVETQTVSRSEGKELAANGAPGAGMDDDWGAAWDDTGEDATTEKDAQAPASSTAEAVEDDAADAWGWGDDDDAGEEKAAEPPAAQAAANADEDPADAWGWGDEDPADPPPVAPAPAKKEPSRAGQEQSQTRELTLKETYHISSLPAPVLSLISAILEDGALLVGSQGSPVAAAAAGLFSLPTLVLAMFRAVSPHYYSLDISGSGNMFLYNDATYLAERLTDVAAAWKAREDIAPRAITMLRLDNDIKTLQSFAARAYASEMSTQRTILRDLLGGAQNLLQQDADASDLSMQIESATTRVRAMAEAWSSVLSRSAWCQAVGSLVDTLASKLVADVMDLPGIGEEEAYNIASMIAKITELDDLFLPAGAGENEVPTTAQYADNWLRLKYLSEVLQSNLPDVKFLWLESDLSLYFGVAEVVDLIGLSFADNAKSREIVREIQSNPHPRA